MGTANDKGVDVCGTDPLRINPNEQVDFVIDALDGKAFQTMRARAALAGYSLYEAGGGFMLCRHDLMLAAHCLGCVGDLLGVQKSGGAL
jgi:hypothetical protein